MDQQQRLGRYRELLLAWSSRINLIGPEVRANLDAHIAEALAAAEILAPCGDCLDFGSGGGLPAIPMAIASTGARFFLVEAAQKKWAFLKRVVRECQLDAVVLGDRLASILPRLAADQRFTLITSRAVGSPEKWVPLLLSRVAPGGRFALFQSDGRAPSGVALDKVEAFRLPRGESNFLVTLVPRGTGRVAQVPG
jgi:16S rRNA (guanine527-N7)-methyltransferase